LRVIYYLFTVEHFSRVLVKACVWNQLLSNLAGDYFIFNAQVVLSIVVRCAILGFIIITGKYSLAAVVLAQYHNVALFIFVQDILFLDKAFLRGGDERESSTFLQPDC